MTLEQYRIRHSMLIEQYQWIEFDLEGLYAAISDDPFCVALQEIEKDSIGGIVREIRKMEIITSDLLSALIDKSRTRSITK